LQELHLTSGDAALALALWELEKEGSKPMKSEWEPKDDIKHDWSANDTVNLSDVSL